MSADGPQGEEQPVVAGGSDSIDLTAALLSEVFPRSDIGRAEYLRWLYERSPFGAVIERNLDDREGRAAHYALVPILLVRAGIELKAALSLNTAVHARARGGGIFVRLASAAIEEARTQGMTAVVGVANANSTPGFVRRLGFRLLGPLPASILPPTPGRRSAIESMAANDPRAAELLAGAATLLSVPADCEGRIWSPETLAWRLARPGAEYVLHIGEGLLAVSCADRRRRIPVAVILKIFSSVPPPRSALHALVRAACSAHRAPLALHVGRGGLAQPRGLPLPGRLRDSPLNLIYRDLRGGDAPLPSLQFELLDFDAY